MCGIIAYIGKKEAYPIIIDGLKKLEYRGYDSAGVAVMNGTLSLHKKQGKVTQLEDYARGRKTAGNIALGHTRWATHGEPNDTNAHPHKSQSGRLVLVHNGIIENYQSIKTFLSDRGYTFQSETDSEVLVQYIEWYQEEYQCNLKEAIRRALGDVEGSYAIVVLDTYQPEEIIVAKHDSPLAIGLANDGFYIASDAGPICKHTNQVIYLNDGEIACLNVSGNYDLIDLENQRVTASIARIEKTDDAYDRDGYETFMLKEIHQQPKTIYNCIKDRIDLSNNRIKLEEVDSHKRIFQTAQRMIIVGCGTSFNAGLIGEHLIESLARIPVEVEYASEFRYRDPVIRENDLVVAISQSGETADTLAAIKLANERGAFTYGIVNTPNSSIARHTDIVSYIKVGTEIGVASTKAFTGQVSLLTLLALKLGRLQGTINPSVYKQSLEDFIRLPKAIAQTLEVNPIIQSIATYIKEKEHTLFLGRGLNFPVALEGALKLKEISYIHAEGHPAAEMKHGHIALIDEQMPVVVLATNESSYQKLVSNVQEIKSRQGKVIVIKNEDIDFPNELADYIVEIPKVNEVLSPIITTIPLQLISYYTAKMKGCHIDQPRNLAKSVTVE